MTFEKDLPSGWPLGHFARSNMTSDNALSAFVAASSSVAAAHSSISLSPNQTRNVLLRQRFLRQRLGTLDKVRRALNKAFPDMSSGSEGTQSSSSSDTSSIFRITSATLGVVATTGSPIAASSLRRSQSVTSTIANYGSCSSFSSDKRPPQSPVETLADAEILETPRIPMPSPQDFGGMELWFQVSYNPQTDNRSPNYRTTTRPRLMESSIPRTLEPLHEVQLDPFAVLSRGGVETIERVLFYFDNISQIVKLQRVCKCWYFMLQHDQVLFSFTQRHFPGHWQQTRERTKPWTISDCVRIAKQCAIRRGTVHLPPKDIRIKSKEYSIPWAFQYRAGYCCVYELWDTKKITVYDLRIPTRTSQSYSYSGTLVSVALGGTCRQRVYLTYCTLDENRHARVYCQPINTSEAAWCQELSSSWIFRPDRQTILKTDGNAVVLLGKDRMASWSINGHHTDEVQIANPEEIGNAAMTLSASRIYTISWGSDLRPVICVYDTITLELLHTLQLEFFRPSSITQISCSLSQGKLHFAVCRTLPELSLTAWDSFEWKFYLLDEARPHPVISDLGNVFQSPRGTSYMSLVQYPAQRKAYVVHQEVESMLLEIVDGDNCAGDVIWGQMGTIDRMDEVEIDRVPREDLQGDEEGLLWNVGRKLRFFRFRP